MTTVYVRNDSTSGGDGTADTTTGVNRAYPSLQAALTAREGTLTEPLIITITKGFLESPTVKLDFDNYTLTASNYVEIVATGEAHHGGVSRERSGTGYQLKRANKCFEFNQYYARFKGFEITNSSTTGVNCIQALSGLGGDIRLEEMIVANTGSANNFAAIQFNRANTYSLINVIGLS